MKAVLDLRSTSYDLCDILCDRVFMENVCVPRRRCVILLLLLANHICLHPATEHQTAQRAERLIKRAAETWHFYSNHVKDVNMWIQHRCKASTTFCSLSLWLMSLHAQTYNFPLLLLTNFPLYGWGISAVLNNNELMDPFSSRFL